MKISIENAELLVMEERKPQGKDCADVLNSFVNNIEKVIVGKRAEIKLIISAWIAGGHVLLEDVPGTGKTILARSIAKSADLNFSRVQFTPDLLPSDILGTSIYNQSSGEFQFQPGPIITTIFLGDEINRATPRTQAAMLESMAEGQVSIDCQTLQLDPLFFTIATQNPVDQLGTFPLPEAQMDRFNISLKIGYPPQDLEMQLVMNQKKRHPIERLAPIIGKDHLLWLKKHIPRVEVSNDIQRYIMSVVTATRKNSDLKLGASPRATIALTRTSQALALFDGLLHVNPGHVFELVKPVISHRLLLTPEAKLKGKTPDSILDEILNRTPAPIQKNEKRAS